MKRLFASLAPLFSFALFACTTDPLPPAPVNPDAGVAETGPETGQKTQTCTKRWGTILRGVPQLESIEVKDGDLLVKNNGKVAIFDCFECSKKPMLMVHQDNFVGDFKANIELAGLIAEGKGEREVYGYVGHWGHDTKARLRLTLSEDGKSIVKIAVNDEKGESVSKDLAEPFPTAASLSFSRAGADVTIKITAGAESVEKKFATQDESLRVGIGQIADQDAPLTLKISKFDLDGGGDKVSADGFECDSLIY